jgi:hypothetical protein
MERESHLVLLYLSSRDEIGTSIRVRGTMESSATCTSDENLIGGGYSMRKLQAAYVTNDVVLVLTLVIVTIIPPMRLYLFLLLFL